MADINNLNEQIDSRIKVFWEQQDKFRNHPLQTELPNSNTMNLSEQAKNDLPAAISSAKNVDLEHLYKLKDYTDDMQRLKKDIEQAFEKGNKVYISGCGASGRLAVALEYLWNVTYPDKKGKVTGVGFRYATLNEAAKYTGLKGFVRNVCRDEVEVVIQGDDYDVKSLITWLHHGPAWARVDEIKFNEQPVINTLPAFKITY